MKRRRFKSRAVPVEAPAPSLVERPRHGLVQRIAQRAATKRVLSVLAHPAAAPVVAVMVGAVLVAVMVGAVIGLALAATHDSGGGEW